MAFGFSQGTHSERASADRGRNWYVIYRCFECHGFTGKGDGPASKDMLDPTGKKVLMPDFSIGKFKGASSPIDLYEVILGGRAGTAMAAYGTDALVVTRDQFLMETAGRKRFPLLEGLSTVYPDERLRDLKKAMEALPTAAEVTKMSDSDKERASNLRRWDLVRYILSLSETQG